ncbi:6341_t:CDS:2 [Entrophospora sp. SA101]|nr:6341_t:CDS:2 [Entrophospora sp. SA101]
MYEYIPPGLNCSKSAGWALTIVVFASLRALFKGKLSLDDLGEHNRIEHDASLTRLDKFLGNQCIVNDKLVDQLLAQEIDSKINLESLAKLRLIRVKQSQEQNKEMVYDTTKKYLAYGESTLLLNFMGHNTNGQMDVKIIEPFFRQEIFPDGWTKPNQQITIPMLVKTFRKLKKRVEELEKSESDKNLVVEENSKTKKTD